VAVLSKALVYGRSLHRIAFSNPAGGMDVLVLSGRVLCDVLITPPGGGVLASAACPGMIVMPRY